MSASPHSVPARRYLLGEATDEECALVEQQYLADEDAVEAIAAAEDDLIEDYLSNALDRRDRDRFERVYLASPNHRVRVETIRRLMTTAQAAAAAAPPPAVRSNVLPGRFARRTSWLALAASLVAAASLSFWLWGRSSGGPAEIAQTAAPQAPAAAREASPAPPASPRLFAVTLSPVAVRSASDSPAIVIPPVTDVVVIQFEREADGRTLAARRVSVRTVSGREVWQGAVAAGTTLPRGIAARAEIPAAQLPADDYLVTLFGSEPTGAEQEWAQYFLRVRTR